MIYSLRKLAMSLWRGTVSELGKWSGYYQVLSKAMDWFLHFEQIAFERSWPVKKSVTMESSRYLL